MEVTANLRISKGTRYMIHPCDICHSQEAVEAPYLRLYTGDQPIHICRNCGFVYVQERRTAQEVADHWSNICFVHHYTALIPAVKARLLYVADFIDSEIGLKNKRVLDLGAGEGYFTELVKKQYQAAPYAVEPSETNCRRMSKLGLDTYQGTAERFASDSAYTTNRQAFDLATITWTLENCVDPNGMLRIAKDCLKPQGHLVIATGSRILVPFKKPLQLYLSPQKQDLHSFRFSINTLNAMLSVNGFTIVKANRYIDSDYLVVIATPTAQTGIQLGTVGDDYLKVYDFFERWHRDSLYYR